MASLIEFDSRETMFPGIRFPEGSARLLNGIYPYGPMRVFTRADVPNTAFVQTSHKTLPEFIAINAKLSVSSEVRALIEALEPGRHQFFEVTIQRERGKKPILRRDGTVLDTPYHLFNPTERLDAVLIEKSVVEVIPRKSGPSIVSALPHNIPKTVLQRSVTEGHHIWKGYFQLGNDTFFSDTLTDAIHYYKWQGLELIPLREE